MKNLKTIRKRYIGLIYVLVIVLIGVIGGGAYFLIGADTTKGVVNPTEPPQLTGNCTAADINLVVDVSGSTTRSISTYKKNLAKFVTATETAVPDTNWTLTSFNNNAQVLVPWSKDTTNILSKINNLSAGGSTATATGIQTALNAGSADTTLGTSNSAKIMLVVTDGMPNVQLSGSSQNTNYPRNAINDAITEANAARAAGYSTIAVNINDGRSSETKNIVFRGLAGIDVPTAAGDIIPASFGNLDTQITKAFGCVSDILSITKTVDNNKPKIGSTVNYTITVTERNSVDQPKATNIKVTDALPAGVTLVKATPSTGTFTNPQWTIPALLQGASATLNVTATVTSSVTPDKAITNTATVVSQDQEDSDLTNNTATATITPYQEKTDIVALTKVVDNDKPKIGSDVNYTITVKNNNSADQSKATHIKISDILPDGISPVVVTPSAGTYTAPNWSIPELNPGDSATLKIDANVTAAVTPDKPLTNTAKVDSLDQEDTNTDNNTATATITPYQEKTNVVSLLKSVDNDKPKIGTNVNYTLTVKNTNPADGMKATNVIVKDTLPAGVTLVKATPSVGTYADPNWTIPELAAGTDATLAIEATVNDSVTPNEAIQNIASITSLDQGDSNLDDNTAFATITPYKDTPPVETPAETPTPTPTPTVTQPEPTVQVADTKTGPNTYVVYAIAALLSALALGGAYLFKRKINE